MSNEKTQSEQDKLFDEIDSMTQEQLAFVLKALLLTNRIYIAVAKQAISLAKSVSFS